MIGNERYQCLAHLTNDAEQKTSQSGSFTVFSVAVNRKLKDKEITKFISCIKGGDNSKLLPYLKKGTYVLLEGSVDGNAYVFSKKGIRNSQSNMQTFSISPQDRIKILSLQIRRDGTCVKKYFSLLAQSYT